VALELAAAPGPRVVPPRLRRRAHAVEAPPPVNGLDEPHPMQPRRLSYTPRPATETLTNGAAPPAERAAESLADQRLADVRRPRPADRVALRVAPKAAMLTPGGSLGPGRLTAPRSLFHRSFEQRQKLIPAMGGSAESEAAVARALAYLARTQEEDGRWTHKPGARRGRSRIDPAVTGLAALCFLAADHTPAKPGPYRRTVAKALDYFLGIQKPDGDLRGGARMYAHAIATLTLAEAAAMTGQTRYAQAAIKGAQFIVKAQHPSTGGWRYEPRQPGDTSVFGWQVMALHSAERLGFRIPDKTRKGASRWLNRVSAGKHKMLAGYTNRSPKPAMAAEAAFSRILLGQRLTAGQQKEISQYLLKHPPGPKNHENFYYWYYASLALMQLRNEAWATWNGRLRDYLLKHQRSGGDRDGSWDCRGSKYGSRGGPIYTTALATLTLEVYYRYLPMYRQGEPGGGESK
jgi:hypothetical protein